MVDQGSFPLESVAGLPHVSLAFPGEHWSDGKATEAITPGSMVTTVASGGKKYHSIAASGTVSRKHGIAMRTVQIPDPNGGPNSLSPNDVMNEDISAHEYVHVYYSGGFHLTLIEPDDSYAPGDLIAWDPAASRPTGISGSGAWKKTSTEANALFVVEDWRPLTGNDEEGVLTVRSLRTQM